MSDIRISYSVGTIFQSDGSFRVTGDRTGMITSQYLRFRAVAVPGGTEQTCDVRLDGSCTTTDRLNAHLDNTIATLARTVLAEGSPHKINWKNFLMDGNWKEAASYIEWALAPPQSNLSLTQDAREYSEDGGVTWGRLMPVSVLRHA